VAFEIDHSRIVAKPAEKLADSDVDGINASGAPIEQG
jgi:hypothetical protein